jgi:hypothetical protein
MIFTYHGISAIGEILKVSQGIPDLRIEGDPAGTDRRLLALSGKDVWGQACLPRLSIA